MRQGLSKVGIDSVLVNQPLGLSTAAKVRIGSYPPLAIGLVALLTLRWTQLLWKSRSVRADVIIVGYMGHFDVHLAKLRFRRSMIVLDHLTGLAETAVDRRLGRGIKTRILLALDSAAIRRADLVVTDTPEQAQNLPVEPRAVVSIPVGAPNEWHLASLDVPTPEGPLRVVFVGLFTPLQGAITIAKAILNVSTRCRAQFTLVGRGQDLPEVRELLRMSENVTLIDWIDSDDLPAFVSTFDVSLGIFGTTPKAQRVVPNKAYQGIAAGTIVITSDTAPQHNFARQLDPGNVRLVPPGDPDALADEIVELSDSVNQIRARKNDTSAFSPATIGSQLLKAIS